MNARRLRIYVGERDKDAGGHMLHETIVHEAQQRGLAGATVFRGSAGFGVNSRVHTAKILRLSEDLPVVVEIIDVAREDRRLPAVAARGGARGAGDGGGRCRDPDHPPPRRRSYLTSTTLPVHTPAPASSRPV